MKFILGQIDLKYKEQWMKPQKETKKHGSFYIESLEEAHNKQTILARVNLNTC